MQEARNGKENALKRRLGLLIDQELYDEANEWLKKQGVQITFTALLIASLREFLDQRKVEAEMPEVVFPLDEGDFQ